MVIPLVNRQKAIAYIAELIKNELQNTMLKEKQLGQVLGLCQGTVSKLKKGKFENIPDYNTLEAIAIYFGYSYSEFIKILEQNPIPLLTRQRSREEIIKAINQVQDIKTLSKIAAIASCAINAKLVQQMQDERL